MIPLDFPFKVTIFVNCSLNLKQSFSMQNNYFVNFGINVD